MFEFYNLNFRLFTSINMRLLYTFNNKIQMIVNMEIGYDSQNSSSAIESNDSIVDTLAVTALSSTLCLGSVTRE